MISSLLKKEAWVTAEAPDSFEAWECRYLPHYPVVKEIKDTTKVRIAFDAFATSERT